MLSQQIVQTPTLSFETAVTPRFSDMDILNPGSQALLEALRGGDWNSSGLVQPVDGNELFGLLVGIDHGAEQDFSRFRAIINPFFDKVSRRIISLTAGYPFYVNELLNSIKGFTENTAAIPSEEFMPEGLTNLPRYDRTAFVEFLVTHNLPLARFFLEMPNPRLLDVFAEICRKNCLVSEDADRIASSLNVENDEVVMVNESMQTQGGYILDNLTGHVVISPLLRANVDMLLYSPRF